MNVLIINLTRFGDLIQTQPVISAFKRRGDKVALACIDNFASATNLLRDLDAVFPFQAAKMLASLDANWRDSVQASVEYRSSIVEQFKPDLVVNLTPSISARLLARNMGVAQVQGFGLDDHGFNADTSSWAAFLQLAGGNRGASPFNICDLFLRTAGLQGEGVDLCLKEPALELKESMQNEFRSAIPECSDTMNGFIAFQLGASENRRRWPVGHFAQLADLVWQRERRIPVVLGTSEEKELGRRFMELVKCPVVDMQGKTTLEKLAASLTECDALVSNDTGTMHLAAGLGVPVVAIFLATAQPWDTGPYHTGCISLEPDMDCHPCSFGQECMNEERCRFGVPPMTVFGQIQSFLGREDTSFPAGARVWKAGFNEDGFMSLSSPSGHDKAERAYWISMQRWFYRRFLDGESLEGWEEAKDALGAEMHASLKKTLAECGEYLFLLQQQGMLLSRNPRPALKEKFLSSWQQLQNILNENIHLDVLSLLLKFESQQQGRDLSALMNIIERYRCLTAAMQEALS